jgi:hypothetical protein
MRQVTGWTLPTGWNEPLYGRTDTKSPTVFSSMVHVAGGEEGSIRHDDDGRPAPSGEGEPDLSEHRLGGVDAVEQACRTILGRQ